MHVVVQPPLPDKNNDLSLYKDNQAKFTKYLEANPDAKPGFDFTVTVLTYGLWPSYKSFGFNLPLEMCMQVYKEFFGTTTNSRRLTWLNSLGTCKLRGYFEPKTMELNVATLQASALLLFNSSDRLSYMEIKDQLDLSDEDCTRLLHALSCAKYKILNKAPNTKTISKTDYFEFNSKFTDKLKRIKIPFPPVDERKKTVQGVAKDRRHTIDAAIVRIMQSCKVLHHQELMTQGVKVLSHIFRPDFKIIKMRIEDLIARDYLERDHMDNNVYRYLA